MMMFITDLRMNAIMVMSPLDDMIILHNNSKVGRDILNKNIECFSLFGEGKSTIALNNKPVSISKTNKVEIPSWNIIKTVTNADDLEVANDASPTIKHFTSAIDIPLFIMKAIISLQDPSPADILIAALKAAEEFDTNNTDPNIPTSTDTMKVIIPFLWVSHHKNIAAVGTAPASSPKIQKRARELHDINLAFTPPPRVHSSLPQPLRTPSIRIDERKAQPDRRVIHHVKLRFRPTTNKEVREQTQQNVPKSYPPRLR